MRSRCLRAGMAVLSLAYGAILWAQQPETANPTSDGSASVNSTAVSPAGATVVPRLISFSGTLKDADAPAEGVGVTFSLYSLPDSGAPLWAELQKVNLDAQGHYTVMLGAVSPDGLPLDLFTSGKALWLGVQPQIPGAGEQPRVLLVAVPYALKAADADTLGGKPASSYLTTDGLLSSATGSATVTASQAGVGSRRGEEGKATSPSPKQSCPSGVGSDGTATANSIAMFTAACNIESSPISVAGGNVGIGTTSNPTATLEVNGTAQFDLGAVLPAIGTGTSSAGANSNPLDLFASSFNSATSAAVGQDFRWLAEPVGNNTGSPAATLSLQYGGGGATPTDTGLRFAPSGQITFASGQTFPGTASNALLLGGNPPSAYLSTTGGTMTGALNLPSSGLTVGTNQLAVSGGNVGIGTANPGSSLTVVGNSEIDFGASIMKSQAPVSTFLGDNGGWQIGIDQANPNVPYRDFFIARNRDNFGNDVNDIFLLFNGSATATLTAGVPAGATTLSLNSPLTIGSQYSTVLIGTVSGGNQETLTVSGGSGTNVLTTSPTRYAHAANSLVTSEGFNHSYGWINGPFVVEGADEGSFYIPGVSNGLLASGLLANPTVFQKRRSGPGRGVRR